LRHHGFDVTTSESSERARELMKSSPFDVLIFGSTLTRDMCWELAEVFREQNSRGKIIEIIPSPSEPVKNYPDAIVLTTDESSRLANIIRDNLRETRSEDDERLIQLSSQAAVEQDQNKLMKLVEEINRLPDGRQKRQTGRSSGDDNTPIQSAMSRALRELAELAAMEQDPQKLRELVSGINGLLDVVEKQLARLERGGEPRH
jgi:hypothetical protein